MQNQNTQLSNVMTVLNNRGHEIATVLPKHISAEKFFQICQTAAMLDPELEQATPSSLFTSFLQCAKDGLVPDKKEAAIVLYNRKQGNNWIKEAQYQPMVDGVLKRIRQSGEVFAIDAKVVYQDDRFEHYTDLDGDHLLHVPNYQSGNRKDSNIMLFFVRAKTKTGEVLVDVMTKSEVDNIMQMSKSAIDKDTGEVKPYSVWGKFYSRMGLKTVIHRIARRLPNSSEVMEMLERDIDMRKMENGVFEQFSPPANQTPDQLISKDQKETLESLVNATGANMQTMFGWVSSSTKRVVNSYEELDQNQYQLLEHQLIKKQKKQKEQAAMQNPAAGMQQQNMPLTGQLA